jgi:hypothetical protein
MNEFLSNPVVLGALSGIVVAAQIDYAAFRSWKSVEEAMKYDWKVAAWRWFQGAVGGAIVAAGIGLV